jgi:hypothetical protein
MTTQNDVPNLPAKDSGQTKQIHGTKDRLAAWRRLPARAACGCAFLLAALVVSLLLASCGEKNTHSSGNQPKGVVATMSGGSPSNPAVAQVAAQDGERKSDRVAAPSGLVSPDVSVELADTVITPGETVELIARVSDDVSEIELWDGFHDKQVFVHDSTAKVWRATYRVPLRPARERLGLSVTAKNDAHRWRRVWVFLRIPRETPEAEPDSLSG